MARRIGSFLGEAKRSLDLALYDIRLPDEPGTSWLPRSALRTSAA